MGWQELAIAIVIAAVYLVVLRLADLNEREPWWALALCFGTGIGGGLILSVAVGSRLLETAPVVGPLSTEVARLLTIAAAFAILGEVERWRGWAEVDGPLDGAIYGAAVGLGMAVAQVALRDLGPSPFDRLIDVGAFTIIWTSALLGLSEGAFGAAIGAGFGASRRNRLGPLGIALGSVGAFLLHLGWRAFTVGGTVSGPLPGLRAVIGWLLPILALAGLIVYALSRERRAIAHLIETESEDIVSASEARRLTHPTERRTVYFRRFFEGGAPWALEHAIHNRQVQLALLLEHARRAPEERRTGLQREAERLRQAIRELRPTQVTTPGAG